MDNDIDEIVSELKEYKQQGLNYYQATQNLKEQSFTDEQISIAGSTFPYTDVTPASIDDNQLETQNLIPQSGQADMSKAEDDLGKALLKDQQNTISNSKFLIYTTLFIAGFSFGWGLMRLYLVPHWFSPSGPNIFSHSSSYNDSVLVRYKYTYPAEAGIVGGLVVTLIYGLYSLFTKKSED